MNKKELEKEINERIDKFEDLEFTNLESRLDNMERAICLAITYLEIYKQPFKRVFMNDKIKFTRPVIDELVAMINRAKQANE